MLKLSVALLDQKIYNKMTLVMDHNLNWHFITAGFGTMNYRARARQLCSEVEALNFFSSSRYFTEKDFRQLLPDFSSQYRKILKPWIHGFGYYIWKPALIHKYLNQLPDESFLVYLDAGFVLDAHSNFKHTFASIKDHTIKHGVTVFTSSQFLEYEFCSQDLLQHLSVSTEDRHSYQHLGGAIFIQNNDKGKAIVDEWMRLTLIDNCRFLVPSSFVFPNPSEFVHHAHDQAILSCLIKTRATKSVTFFEGFVPQSSASSHREVATTAPFIPARHRYAFPIHSKSILRRFFWKTIAIISKARLAICRRVFKKSVDSFLDR